MKLLYQFELTKGDRYKLFSNCRHMNEVMVLEALGVVEVLGVV